MLTALNLVISTGQLELVILRAETRPTQPIGNDNLRD